jgi:hypothetical protein
MRESIRFLGLAGVCGLAWTAVGAAENQAANVWSRLGDGLAGERTGSVLLYARDAKRLLLLGGEHKGLAPVQAFDLAAAQWSEFATNALKNSIHPYYQAAYHPKSKTVYCLSNGSVLYSFDAQEKTWRVMAPVPALEQLSWLSMACDAEHGWLVVVGADKRIANAGSTRTVVYDIAARTWETLPSPGEKTVNEHQELVTVMEGVIDLAGRTRLAWFRDPNGIGTDAELKALEERCDDLAKLPGIAAFRAGLGPVGEALKAQKALDALRSARALQREIEERAAEQYPVPPSRRNAPLVFDEKNRVFVLFGGDHEDYQMNDTWILDLERKSWRRAKPELAPSPRAGHAMVYLPNCGRVAIYEGYAASSDPSYGASPAWTLNPRELWLYDAQADRWDLAGAWPAKGGREPAPPSVGAFYGYSSSWFAVPALAADGGDQLFLFAPSRKQEPGALWTLRVDPGAVDAAGRAKLGQPPNQRRMREEYFRADYCEVAERPKQLDLDALPANQWVAFPRPARVPASGCRQRDWGTAVWDGDRGQILLWGGGHCVRSSSVVLHFSPESNRFAEGYDADEPYCYNGFCGPGSSLLNRQWIDCHAYNLYAYDPKCRLLVTARGFLYDPVRMDWVRTEPFPPPFAYSWSSVVVESSAHGAVAWGKKTNSDEFNLWLFDRQKGWTDLQPKGKLYPCYCDSDGMVYDSKRDRMLLGWGGGYGKRGDGRITVFDFQTKAVEKIIPANLELGQTSGTREMVYVPEADLVLFGSEGYGTGDPQTGKRLTRVYDCGKNRYGLLDGGPVAYGHSAGWMYDSRRRCAYVMSFRGECWAMRIDPLTLSPLDQAPGPRPLPSPHPEAPLAAPAD